ncbi:cbb3-type cytochrome c oxidase N-terminal domain-containing protein [Chitinophagaceae bacterium MMS25-I14]
MHQHFQRFALTLFMLFSAGVIKAADIAEPSGSAANIKEAQGLNVTLVSLVTLIVVLLFVIGITANVLRQLSFVYRDKMRKDRSGNSNVFPSIVLLLAGIVCSIPAFAADAATSLPVKEAPVFISGIPADDFYLIIGIIALELTVLFVLMLCIRILIRLLAAKPETAKVARAIVRRSFMDRFNKSVSVEKEKDIMLDHDYDGIHELDNSLPPWWKYGFYLTIFVAIIYLYYYHVGGGPSSHEEYVTAVEKGKEEVAAYLATSANNVDENSVTPVTDAAQLNDARSIFETTCSACHAKDGGGGIGPNLTDPYWLHGGDIKDVFKSIKYGWQDKGMKSWKDDYSPKQIAGLASYVRSLQGSKPANPKSPQGDKSQETNTAKTGRANP